MLKKLFSAIIILFILNGVNAQKGLKYFLPENITYNRLIPSPDQFAGHEIGEYHLTHDKLYYYMLELAGAADRAIWEEYGKSHEGRPLGHLIISSPDNIDNLDQIRLEHLRLCDPAQSGSLDVRSMPVFIKLGYGIHGNESSAQNSSVLVAYYLTAGEGAEIDELLENAVIMIDPSLNPDGMQRHSTWVNSAKGLVGNSNPASWEFSEPWPGGRTNHYWFDLNRDYIMLQHPETVGRVAAFHKWKPNIITDHHETGANETFFFQPGIQSRNNPLIPPDNQMLTAEIGKYHEKYLNATESLYFTEESFDDFYLGKGSSYPDIHGSVGILFEQAGTKGHLRETEGGLLTFPFAIRNQVTVSLSTLEAGLKMKDKLLESQRSFYRDAMALSDKHKVKAYVFTDPSDKARVDEFISILLQHRIKVFRLAKDVSFNGLLYKAEDSYVVPLRQTEYRFVRSLFEPVKEFTDSAFYDTSTWVLPMAFNIEYSAISTAREMEGLTGEEIAIKGLPEGRLLASDDTYAYLFGWNEYFAPRALYMLQDAGLRARVATSEFACDEGPGIKRYSSGTIMISSSGQPFEKKELHNLMKEVAEECGITIQGVKTGLTPEGIDLGSSKFVVLKKPSVMVIVGNGINSADAGEIWHLLDVRFRMPVTLVTSSGLLTADLNRFNVIIVAGSPQITPTGIEKIRGWSHDGGVLIGYKSGNLWLERNKFAEIEYIPTVEIKNRENVYANRSVDNQVQQIPGSIFETKLDLTHPLCFGFTKATLPVFKSGTAAAKKNADIYNNPVIYSDNPLLSGYCTKENIERIEGAAFASVHGNRIISIYDNTNFRAFWYGTNKIFLNAVFFGQIIR